MKRTKIREGCAADFSREDRFINISNWLTFQYFSYFVKYFYVFISLGANANQHFKLVNISIFSYFVKSFYVFISLGAQYKHICVLFVDKENEAKIT